MYRTRPGDFFLEVNHGHWLGMEMHGDATHSETVYDRGHVLTRKRSMKKHTLSNEILPVYLLQGLSLLKQLIELDEWTGVLAVARSELPFRSNKIKRIALDLNNKEVSATCGPLPVLGLLYSAGLVAGHAASESESMFAQPVNCPKASALQALSKELKDNDGHAVTHVFHLAFHGEPGRPLVLCLTLCFAKERSFHQHHLPLRHLTGRLAIEDRPVQIFPTDILHD